MSRRRNLTFKEESRIRHAINDCVMHFSPTISPAPKREDLGEIESISGAVDYYREMGERFLIMEPKYMGSYCDIYLHRDIEKTRFFSRKGYPVPSLLKHDDLIEAIRWLHDRFKFEFDHFELEVVIIQAELMPWSALGKGLIQREFRGYEECHQTHCNYIANSDLNSLVDDAKNDPEYHQFLLDQGLLSKKEIKQKYPDHIVKHYEALSALELPNKDRYQEAINIYREQVDIYGAEGELHFKPFNWLKKIYSDGKEIFCKSNLAGFVDVCDSNEPYAIIDLEATGEEGQFEIDNAYAVYEEWTKNQKMEGAVIKPKTVWRDDMAPMFKVRNPNYLQMIYGVRFQEDFDYYMKKRGIKKKMRCSINEWNIAQSLLRIPMREISPDNKQYVDLVTARILEEDFEASLDTRL